MNKKIIERVKEAAKRCGYGVKFDNKNQTFTVCRSYFYRTVTPEEVANKFLNSFETCTLIDTGDHWHAFVGGTKAYSRQDSYVWAKFKLKDGVVCS